MTKPHINRSRALIPSDSVRLEGELVIPEGSRGVVLFAHGSGSSRLSPRNQYVAQTLQQAGVGTLLFDLLTDEEAEDREKFSTSIFSPTGLATRRDGLGRGMI